MFHQQPPSSNMHFIGLYCVFFYFEYDYNITKKRITLQFFFQPFFGIIEFEFELNYAIKFQFVFFPDHVVRVV